MGARFEAPFLIILLDAAVHQTMVKGFFFKCKTAGVLSWKEIFVN
jgi:hypothetical protein